MSVTWQIDRIIGRWPAQIVQNGAEKPNPASKWKFRFWWNFDIPGGGFCKESCPEAFPFYLNFFFCWFFFEFFFVFPFFSPKFPAICSNRLGLLNPHNAEFTEFPVESLCGIWNLRDSRSKCPLAIDGRHHAYLASGRGRVSPHKVRVGPTT